MAVRPIILWPDPRLKQRCTPISAINDDIRALAQDLLDTMYAARGRGLAGPQVGELLRIFVMDVTWKEGQHDPQVILNPDILLMSDERASGPEGCLSIPGLSLDISRARALRLRWTTLAGGTEERELTGPAAVCAQHEFDHLDGIVTFDRIAPDARAKLVAGYGA